MKMEFTASRRAFLKSAAILAGFSTWLGRGAPTAAASKPVPVAQKESGQGYRLTEQVKKYYETARF